MSGLLAAITLDPRGGGVAAASRLLWQAMQAQFGAKAELIELVDRQRSETLESGFGARVQFGASIALREATGRCAWVLYSHLAVAQVQQFVPAMLRKPYAVFVHGIEVWRPLSPAQKRILRGAALRLANSSFTARTTHAMHPDVGHIAPCPLAIPSSVVEAPRRSRDSCPTVVIVARMLAAERYKGHDQLLDCWPRVLRAVPNARLVVVGDGDDRERLMQKARDLGVAGATEFTGFLTDGDLLGWYDRSWAFAMPSRGEGFGLVYLEAMARGLPCVGSTQDAAGDIVIDGETGYLVPQDDLGALSERLIRLLQDEGLRTGQGARGLARVRQEFGIEQFSDRLAAALVPVAASSSRSVESCL